MIKISKYLYIHFLTVLLFVICYITRRLELLFVSYLIMLVHELAHLFAALSIGLIPSRIVFYPFGVNLKLKNKIVYSVYDEIILYISGPLSNVLMALIVLFFKEKNQLLYFFYLENISLFIMNMLPIVPLDGGIILKKIISEFTGYKIAENIMKVISVFFVTIIIGIDIYLALSNKLNYSLFFLIVFILCNIITTKEKYNIDFIREVMFYKKKGKKDINKRIKFILVKEDVDYKKIVKLFSVSFYYIILFLNNRGNIINVMTETEILDNISEGS